MLTKAPEFDQNVHTKGYPRRSGTLGQSRLMCFDWPIPRDKSIQIPDQCGFGSDLTTDGRLTSNFTLPSAFCISLWARFFGHVYVLPGYILCGRHLEALFLRIWLNDFTGFLVERIIICTVSGPEWSSNLASAARWVTQKMCRSNCKLQVWRTMPDRHARAITSGRVHVCSFRWNGFFFTRWRYLLIIIRMHVAPRSFLGVSMALLKLQASNFGGLWRVGDAELIRVLDCAHGHVVSAPCRTGEFQRFSNNAMSARS